MNIVIADLKTDIFLVVVQNYDGGRELPLVFLQRASIASIENEKKSFLARKVDILSET